MQKLVQGIHEFQQNVFPEHKRFFENLEKGQNPSALFLTCSDSRINPNLITQTEPGELFIVRNAGNIVASAQKSGGGEIASIEYAVAALKIRDLIICGHNDCGAMRGLIDPSLCEKLPHMKEWLTNTEKTKNIIQTAYQHLKDQNLLTATVEENVLVQIENLLTHDFIRQAVDAKQLRLHAWVYHFSKGDIFSFDQEKHDFISIADHEPRPIRVSQISELQE